MKNALEQIRAEIDRLKQKTNVGYLYLDNWDQEIGYSFALDEVVSYLDNVQEQEPKVDLEKEVEKYYYDNFAFLSSAHTPTLDILRDIASHFFELGKNGK